MGVRNDALLLPASSPNYLLLWLVMIMVSCEFVLVIFSESWNHCQVRFSQSVGVISGHLWTPINCTWSSRGWGVGT